MICPKWKVICCSLLRKWDRGEEQQLEVSTRGRARGDASTLQLWLFSQGSVPAWEVGSRWRILLPHGATHICQSAPPAGPTASVWWCVSNHLQTNWADDAVKEPCSYCTQVPYSKTRQGKNVWLYELYSQSMTFNSYLDLTILLSKKVWVNIALTA